MLKCDPETGLCSLTESSAKAALQAEGTIVKPTVRYIGDPMCSWCWVISPALKQLASYERAKKVLFSEPYYVGGIAALVKESCMLPNHASARL